MKIKLSIFLIFFGMFFNACRRPYGCADDEPHVPFIDIRTKDWVLPYESSESIFVSQDSNKNEIKIYRSFESTDIIGGGDECLTSDPRYNVNFEFDSIGSQSYLLITSAVYHNIWFGYEGYSDDRITNYDVYTSKFSNYENIEMTDSDTLINGQNQNKVSINVKYRLPFQPLKFNKLIFVRGTGVVSYTDTLGVVWNKK